MFECTLPTSGEVWDVAKAVFVAGHVPQGSMRHARSPRKNRDNPEKLKAFAIRQSELVESTGSIPIASDTAQYYPGANGAQGRAGADKTSDTKGVREAFNSESGHVHRRPFQVVNREAGAVSNTSSACSCKLVCTVPSTVSRHC
jgi:hypothetical protein